MDNYAQAAKGIAIQCGGVVAMMNATEPSSTDGDADAAAGL